jgi:hypothetical protein
MRSRVASLASVLSVMVVVGVGLVPGVALGAFSRSFVRQVFRSEEPVTKLCSVGEEGSPGSSCLNPGGLTVGPVGGVAPEDTLWVGDQGFSGEAFVDEFQPAFAPGENAPIAGFRVGGAGSVAVERALPGSGDVYTVTPSGSVEVYGVGGGLVESWGAFTSPRIAVDDSTSPADPSACGVAPLSSEECVVYVSSGGFTLKRFDSKGVAEPFTATGLSYVTGNEITGAPTGCGTTFRSEELKGIAVDPKGDIYVTGRECGIVFEYAPTGKFLKSFALTTATPIGAQEKAGEPVGVAFDAASGNLLVAAAAEETGKPVGAIDEFNAQTGSFVAQITAAGESKLEQPETVATDSKGDVYVVDRARHAVDGFGPGAYRPTVTLAATSARTPTSAVLNGTVNPAQARNETKAPLTECFFEYVEEGVYSKAVEAKEEEGFPKAKAKVAQCSPAAGVIPVEPESEHHVEGKLENLTAGATYRYRLVATTDPAKNGGTTASGQVPAFTAPAPPGASAAAENVSSTSVDLHAQINPLGAQTTYLFEYGPTSAYGQTIPAAPGDEIGEGGPTGSSLEGVLQHLEGLTPGSTYHFRVVASSECEAIEHPGTRCTTNSVDQTFTTLPAPVTSERAYELVTPANKEGGSDMFNEARTDIENNQDVGEPSGSGEEFVFTTRSSFGEFPFAFGGSYVFKREAAAGRWSYVSLAAPELGIQVTGGFPLVEPFSFGRVAFNDALGASDSETGSRMTNLIGPPGGPYLKLHEDPGIHGTAIHSTRAVGASRDLKHVVLESSDTKLCQGGETIKHGAVLCEWDGGFETLEDGEVIPELRLVDVSPVNEAKPASECGARLGSADDEGGATGGLAHGAVSGDGSRVFFTAPGPEVTGVGACWNGVKAEEKEGPRNAPQLYARVAHSEESGEVTHKTFQVSEPEAGVLEAGHTPVRYPAIFVGASEDGTKVFFQTRTWVTANHPENHVSELYECEVQEAGCKLTRVSAGETGSEAEKQGARVLFVPAVSADGSSVYFTAFSALAAGATHDTTAGQDDNAPINLYRYDTNDHSTGYVATVDTEDFSEEPECNTFIAAEAGVMKSVNTAPCSRAQWYTTADGRFLLFGASLPIDGYNTIAGGCAEPILPQTQGKTDGRCSELYRFSVGAVERGEAGVVCVSCGGGGVDSAGNAEFARSSSNGAVSGPVAGMSENGEFVFFDSQASLVAGADNHTLDTYEWREDPATGERSVGLVGSGSDNAPTFFLGYSPFYLPDGVGVEGGNVFIGTHAKLSSQQTNSLGNIYDARLCVAGSPCIEPPAAGTAQCEGGSCQVVPAQPVFQTPATLAGGASGNVRESPPAAGPPVSKTAAQVRAERLTKVLKVCRRDRSKRKRAACEKQARKRYSSKSSKGHR